jgi:hypothetical protein
LAAISPGGSNVPRYTVINQHIDYKFDENRGKDVPVIGGSEPLFGKAVDAAAAEALDKGKYHSACCGAYKFPTFVPALLAFQRPFVSTAELLPAQSSYD